ncbi:hypothetical protein PIB30_067137 [Stylosanthes scabra]|uniref:Uncharacterized protein n=1 Tax=Stylosanthes scabra TaxID=79078 RepID=A0ABU6WKV8_9FABA|nr:hypothetical protein [Stylosanthes scabra]
MAPPTQEEIAAADRDIMYWLDNISQIGHNVNTEVKCIISVRRQLVMPLHLRVEPYVERAGLHPMACLGAWFKREVAPRDPFVPHALGRMHCYTRGRCVPAEVPHRWSGNEWVPLRLSRRLCRMGLGDHGESGLRICLIRCPRTVSGTLVRWPLDGSSAFLERSQNDPASICQPPTRRGRE